MFYCAQAIKSLFWYHEREVITERAEMSVRTPPPSPSRNPPLVGQALLTVEASRSHSDTPPSVGLLWKSDQPVTDTSTWQHSLQTSIPPRRFESTIAADPCLRLRGHRDGIAVPLARNAWIWVREDNPETRLNTTRDNNSTGSLSN